MSYKLEKPYTPKQKSDFIVEYIHNKKLNFEETDSALYALDPNEIMQDGKVIMDPDYEAKQAQIERERLNNLTMTKRVLWLQLKELGITYQQLKDLIATNEDAQAEWDLCETLKRDNPLLDIMGAKLNITPEQIDEMFKIANGEVQAKEDVNGAGEASDTSSNRPADVNNSEIDVNNSEKFEAEKSINNNVSEDEL